MRIVGGLFADKQDMTLALEDLQEKGFVAFKVFGPAELYRSPGTEDDVEESIVDPEHTAAGAVEGITYYGVTGAPDDPSAQPVGDDLRSIGLPDDVAEEFVAGLHQDQVLLLVQTKASRAGEAVSAMEERGAQLTHSVHPTDAFPEEEWL